MSVLAERHPVTPSDCDGPFLAFLERFVVRCFIAENLGPLGVGTAQWHSAGLRAG
jgi:hypothetical protein